MHDHHEQHIPHNKEEAIALLEYMVHHNLHHTEELHELAHEFTSEKQAILHQAVEEYEKANATLKKALEAIKG